MTGRANRGREIVREVFGGALYQQGRGFYSALELLAILRGEVLLETHERRQGVERERVLPTAGPVEYLRPGHDHARRLLVSSEPVVDGVFPNAESFAAVKALLRGIEAPVPGRRRASDKWQLRHFYPYPAEAVHYDAVERRGKVSVERYQFRGAGGLAHKILRTDPDTERLSATRGRFRQMMSDSGSAVGSLLERLAATDAVPGQMPPEAESDFEVSVFEDDVEEKSLAFLDAAPGEEERGATRWMHLLREGVHRIVTREELSAFDRIDGLMHWVPWCVARHQLAMARRKLGKDEDAPIVHDMGHRKSPVRSRARRHLSNATAAIKESLHRGAIDAGEPALTTGSASWWTGPRSFFTTTMFAVGALNANAGLRHFKLRPELLQAIVQALVDAPISLELFSTAYLGERLRLICDRKSASRFRSIGIDGRDLQTNGEALASRLDEVGLLRAFSDSTLMVGIHE